VTYDLKPIEAPRLAGTALQLFTSALESPLTGWMLVPKLLKDAGFTAWRKRSFDAIPSVAPILPAGSSLPEGAGGPPPDLAALAGAEQPATTGFAFETAAQLARAYRDGTADPIAVAERALAAIDASEQRAPAMRLFISLDRDDVLTQARASAQRHAAGAPLGPLDGVPVAIKDELDQLPYPTSVGTALPKEPATSDATAVARLRAQGAVLLGKANMHEIGIGVNGLNPHHGTPRNPYDDDRYCGGSSSGPAATVAAGICPLSIGADGGGSIRNPAAFCGVVGLKATWGRISEHGAAPLVWSMGHVGPIGATALDCALGYAALAGPDDADPRTAIQPPPTLDGFGDDDLTGVRIGVYEPWFSDADDEVVAACRATLERLKEAGAVVKPVELPELEATRIAHVVTIVTEMAVGTEADYRKHRKKFGLDVRINLALGKAFTNRDYVKAQQVRSLITGLTSELLTEVDVLATPTAGCVAPRIKPDALRKGESDLVTLGRIMRFAPLANLTGFPAISFPAGYTDEGMPVGFMALGRPWEEHLLLRLADASERRLERREPQVRWSLLGA
jgi:Asp-tRNA(Asn)/Glu-tRNA(Gln) amidotransferase A subunit family amidase